MITRTSVLRTLLALSATLSLGAGLAQSGEGAASDAGGPMAAGRTVEITVVNDTDGQVFSAPVALAHGPDYRPFAPHRAALPELVPLAEDGRTTDLATVAAVLPSIGAMTVADGPLAPGERVTLALEVDAAHPLVSVFGMLVSSNDAVFVFGADLSSAFPEPAMSADAMGEGAMGEDAMSGDAMGEGGMSGDAMGDSSMSSEAMGEDPMSDAGSSEGAMAGGEMSGDAMSGDAMSGDAMSDGAMSDGAMAGDSMSGDAMSGDAMSGDAMSGGSMADGAMAADAMGAAIDLYDGTVRVLDAGSEANTESCAEVPGPPCGSAGVRHTAMAEGTVEPHPGLRGDGDLDAAVYGWTDPVASVSLAFR